MFNFVTDQLWKGGAIVAVLLAVAAGLTSAFLGHELDKERIKSAQLSGRIHELNEGIAARELDAASARSAALGKAEEERDRIAQLQLGIGNAKLAEKERALADARAAADASRRMLQRVGAEHQAAADNDRRAAGTKLAGLGQAAESTGGLCPVMLSRMDQDARLIGEFADASSIAGSECEQRYDALKKVDSSASSSAH